MKIDGITVAGLVASLFLVFVLAIFIARNSFPAFLYAPPVFRSAPSGTRLAPVTQPLGPAESGFMWKYRYWDLIAQAFVLFAAAAGCLAILRIEGNKKSETG
jgi:hypothetical protein